MGCKLLDFALNVKLRFTSHCPVGLPLLCRHLSSLTGVSFTQATLIKDLPRNLLFGVHVFIPAAREARDGHLSKFPISLMNNARVSAACTMDGYIAAISNDDKSEREWPEMKEGSLGKRRQKTEEVSAAVDERRRKLFSQVHDIVSIHTTAP